MNMKKTKIMTMSLLVVLLAGAAIAWAYFTSKDSADNIFKLANRYTLTYHANTGSAAEDDTVANLPDQQKKFSDGTTDVTFDISTSKPIRGGFVFTGWNTKDDGNGDDYYLGGSLTVPKEQKESHLYAKWQAGYTLIYDANGGSDAPPSEDFVSNENSVTFPSVAAQGGMKFETEVAGEKTTEAKVFLGWSENKNAKIPTYTSNGNLAYSGSDYDGDTTSGFETTVEVKSTDVDPETQDIKTKRLYAVWATRYKLIFDKNEKYNGSGNVPPTQTKVSTKEEVSFDIIENNDDNDDPAITPKRTDADQKGYRFGWWCDDADSRNDGPGTYQYGDKGVYVQAVSPGGFREDPWRKLYAIYKPPKTLGLYYNANGGSFANANTTVYKTYWGSVLTDKQLVDIPAQPKDNNGNKLEPTRSNYIFMGWSKDPKRTKNLEMPSDEDTRLSEGDFKPDGDKIRIDIWKDAAPTLYAVWRPQHKFGVHFYLNGGTRVHYKNNQGKWTTSSNTGYWESPYLNDENTIVNEYHGFDAEFFKDHGIYATRNDDATGSFEFLGWSYNKDNKPVTELTADDVDIRVELPSDPLNPTTTATGTQGCITEEIPVYDEDPDSCTKPGTHWTDLYAVWKKTPLHSYKLVFTNKDVPNNANMAGVTIINKVNGSSLSHSESASKDKPIISVKKGKNGEDLKSEYNISGRKFEKMSLSVAANPSVTWEASELSSNTEIPYAKKDPTDTEMYVFKGWSYWPNSDTVHITVDEEGKINTPITVEDPSPDTCEGNIHYMLLFPVFETVPRHTYNVFFVPNYTTMSGYNKTMQYEYSYNGSTRKAPANTANYKGIVDIYGTKHENLNQSGQDTGYAAAKFTSSNQALSETSWGADGKEWKQSYTMINGSLITSCTKNSSAPASSPDFEFLGWSYNKDNKALDQLDENDVDVRIDKRKKIDDPNNLGAQIDNPDYGKLIDNIIINETDVTDTDGKCSDSEGRVHNLVLYGVWKSDKAHQYTVIFSGSLKGAKIMAKKNDTSADFESKSTKTLSNITDYEGNVYDKIEYAWECDSPAEKLELDTDRGFTWTAEEWSKKGVYAEKEKDAKFKYHFLGWSTNPANKDPETLTAADVDVEMGDTDARFIKTSFTIRDNDIANCPGNNRHYDVLYAVWEKETIPATHTFSVKFNLNNYNIEYSGASYKYFDGVEWKTSNDSKYGTYTTDELKVSENQSYTFTADYWKNTAKGLGGTKSNSNTKSFDFLGWSYGREGKQAKDLTEEDVDIRLDDDGFISGDIKVDCNDSNCEDGKHERTLYAVWKAKPLTKTYTLKFDLNTKAGEDDEAGNAPNAMTGEEIWGATNPGNWVNSYTFNLEKIKPYYKSMAFVGWGDSKTDMPGKYGHIYDDDNPELADTKRNLKSKVTLSTTSGNSNPVEKTVYAIWAYEYQMTYDSNDGSSAPSMEHEYTNSTSHIYTLSERVPERRGYTFLGWADSDDVTEPDYYPNNSQFGNDKPKSITLQADPSGSTKIRIYAVWQQN